MAASRKKRKKPDQPISTDSTYCILWAGFKGIQVVADGKGIRMSLKDEPVAVYEGYETQKRLNFEEER